jgi:charged multivesicular body protein 7
MLRLRSDSLWHAKMAAGAPPAASEFDPPEDWGKPDVMGQRFARMPHRADDPDGFDAKLRFWSRLIAASQAKLGLRRLRFTRGELERRFAWNNHRPDPIGEVLACLHAEGKVLTVAEAARRPTRGLWGAVRNAVPAVLSWAWGARGVGDETEFVDKAALQAEARALLQRVREHEARAPACGSGVVPLEAVYALQPHAPRADVDLVLVELERMGLAAPIEGAAPPAFKFALGAERQGIASAPSLPLSARANASHPAALAVHVEASDAAVAHLKSTLHDLGERATRLDAVGAERRAQAVAALRQQNRAAAAHHLQAFKFYAARAAKTLATRLNVEQILASLDAAHSDRLVVRSMSAGSKALRALQQEFDLSEESVEAVVDEVRDALARAEEIGEAVAQDVAPAPVEGVDEELADLMRQLSLEEAPPVPVPAAPAAAAAVAVAAAAAPSPARRQPLANALPDTPPRRATPAAAEKAEPRPQLEDALA